MSKYIDKDKVLEYIIFGVVGKDITCGELTRAIESLPTIEVSEDCISRYYERLIESDEDAYYGDWNETYERGFSEAINKVLDAPSVVPTDKCKVCQQYDIGFEDGRLDMLRQISDTLKLSEDNK